MAWDRGDQRHGGQARVAILLGSIGIHLLVLAVLGLWTLQPALQTPPEPPMLELRLLRSASTPQPPRPPLAAGRGVSLEPPADKPAGKPQQSPHQASVASGSNPEAPSADASTIHFYQSNGADCAKEDLALLGPAERIRCANADQRLGALPHRPIPTDGAELNGIDPRKRSTWDADVAAAAARRDGTAGQASLGAIKAARGAFAGPSDKVDINVGFTCKVPFGSGSSGGLKCGVGSPVPNPPPPR